MRPIAILILHAAITHQLMGQLSFSISTDKSIYDYNDPILVTMTARNSGSVPDTLWFTTGCQFNYRIDTLDYMRHDSLAILCTQAFSERIVLSNDSTVWGGTDCLYNFTGGMLGPGRHAVTGWLSFLPSGWVSDTLWIWVTPVSGVKEDKSLPKYFLLQDNYPNPFNPATTIEYSLPYFSYVTLRVFNLLGEVVTTLVRDELQIGRHRAQWVATSSPSGVYYYRLETDSYIETKKLLLLK